MATLRLKSERQIQAGMLARLIAKLNLNDVNPGSVVDVITQAAAQEDFARHQLQLLQAGQELGVE